jgi:hypothetical protein
MAKQRGRPRHDPPLRAVHVRLTEEQLKLLRAWGHGDVSAGMRWVVDTVSLLLVRKKDEKKQE